VAEHVRRIHRILVGQADAFGAGFEIRTRQARRIGGIGQGLGLPCACFGFVQAGVVLQCFVDQRAQLRVAEAYPPILRGPCRGAELHLAETALALEAARVERLAGGMQAARRGATGKGDTHGQACRGQ